MIAILILILIFVIIFIRQIRFILSIIFLYVFILAFWDYWWGKVIDITLMLIILFNVIVSIWQKYENSNFVQNRKDLKNHKATRGKSIYK